MLGLCCRDGDTMAFGVAQAKGQLVGSREPGALERVLYELRVGEENEVLWDHREIKTSKSAKSQAVRCTRPQCMFSGGCFGCRA